MKMKKITTLLLSLVLVCGYVSAKQFTVVIDAGHGGDDGGAARGKIKEKDINLAVALSLGKLIESSNDDIKVVYTRKTDVKTGLDKRASIANKAKANLFISIHTNSTDDKVTSAKGADTYILGLARSKENMRVAQRENSVITLEENYKQKYEDFDPSSPESYIIFEFMTNKYMEQSLEFAGIIQDKFRNSAKRNDRGVRQAGFLVLRETACPSVLIELGFINNPDEAKYLASAIGQRTMASAIYSAFKEYKKDFDKRQGSETAYVPNKNTTAPVIEQAEEEAKPVTATNKVDTTPTPQSSGTTFVSKPKTNPVITGQDTKNTRTEAPEKTTTTASIQAGKNTTSSSGNSISASELFPSSNGNSDKTSVSSNEIEYRVQITINAKSIQLNASNFKGLSPIDVYQDNGIYKYTYGSTTNQNEARRLLREAKTKYSDAFIVEFKNGKRVK